MNKYIIDAYPYRSYTFRFTGNWFVEECVWGTKYLNLEVEFYRPILGFIPYWTDKQYFTTNMFREINKCGC